MILPFPKKTIERTAARFAAKKIVSEQAVKPGEEAHILHPYEPTRVSGNSGEAIFEWMPLKDIIEIGRLGLAGKLENVQEKMDGQFLAFTVVDSQLKFFTKMDLQGKSAKEKRLKQIQDGGSGSGMNLEQIMSTYSGERSSVAEGFAIAYNALLPIVFQYEESLFRGGEVIIVSQILVSKNPNTILYNKDSLRTVLAVSLTDEPVDKNVFSVFKTEMNKASTDAFTMDDVPTAKLIKGLQKDDNEIKQLEKELEKTVGSVGLSVNKHTVGDYIVARLEEFIRQKYKFIPNDLVNDVAVRFATGMGKVSLKIKKRVSSDDYKKFRALDKVKSRIVQEAIIPLEVIIQKIGIMIIDKLDLALTASNHDELLRFIKNVRSAFESGFDFGLGGSDEKTLEGIRVALERLAANEDLFIRATEGIVFTYRGKTYKLTGLFTPINKMRGFFGNVMGREGFGRATLPEKGLDEHSKYSSRMTLLLEITKEKMMCEGGAAFKATNKEIFTVQERIPRSQVQKIVSKFDTDVLSKLGLNYIAVGSTNAATGRETVGDIDLAVDESDKEVLYNKLKSVLPATTISLQNGSEFSGERVIKIGSFLTVLFEFENEKYVQIDVMPSKNIENTAWIMNGGTKDGFNGAFRNLLLNFITNKLSDDKKVYSFGFPAGFAMFDAAMPKSRRKNAERITDPDIFLPILGVDVPSESVVTFKQLFNYLLEKNGKDYFIGNTIKSDLIEYISNSKRVSSRDEVIDYVRDKLQASISETKLRNVIVQMLLEQDVSREEELDSIEDDAEVEDDQIQDFEQIHDFEKEKEIASKISNIKSFTGKARLIFSILQSNKFFGSSMEKIITASQGRGIIRFGIASDALEKVELGKVIGFLYDILVPDHTGSVIELAPNEAPNPSSKYSAYQLPEYNNLMLVFGIAGVTGGARKAGYVYEIGVREALSSIDSSVAEGPDNSYSDIYMDAKNGRLGIEVKLPNAQAGEPTLRYDYDKEEFFASNPKPQNDDIANLINLDPSSDIVKKKFKLIRDVINKFRKSKKEPEIESILGNISKEEYVSVVQPALQGSGSLLKGKLLASYIVSARILRIYYMFKLAGLVQVKTKGLYHLHESFKVSFVDSSGNTRSTELFEFPDARGSVYFRNFRGGRYGIRAQLASSPLNKLNKSNVDLDNEEDRKLFVKEVKSMSFPDPKKLAFSLS